MHATRKVISCLRDKSHGTRAPRRGKRGTRTGIQIGLEVKAIRYGAVYSQRKFDASRLAVRAPTAVEHMFQSERVRTWHSSTTALRDRVTFGGSAKSEKNVDEHEPTDIMVKFVHISTSLFVVKAIVRQDRDNKLAETCSVQ